MAAGCGGSMIWWAGPAARGDRLKSLAETGRRMNRSITNNDRAANVVQTTASVPRSVKCRGGADDAEITVNETNPRSARCRHSLRVCLLVYILRCETGSVSAVEAAQETRAEICKQEGLHHSTHGSNPSSTANTTCRDESIS